MNNMHGGRTDSQDMRGDHGDGKAGRWHVEFRPRLHKGVCERCGTDRHVHRGLCRPCRDAMCLELVEPGGQSARRRSGTAAGRLKRPPWQRRGA